MNPCRILIVEDEAIVAMDIRDRLAAMGYQAAGHATSGEHALALAEEERPDLVLMDIRLQGAMDGIAAAEEIRRRFHVPAIFLTAYSEEAALERIKLAEPYGYILKPFDDRQLKSAIEIALYKHRTEEEIRRLNRLFNVLSQVNQSIVRIRTREELLPTVCRLVVERGEMDLAWIGWLDPSSSRISPVAHFGNGSEILSEAGFYADGGPEGQATPGRVIREGNPFVCNQCGGGACLYPSAQAPARFGFQSCASFPLRFQGQICGALSLCASEPGFFREREVELLQEVALDISFALDKIEIDAQHERLNEQLKRQSTFLQTLIEAMPYPVFYKDARLRYLGCNTALERLVGVRRDRFVGKTVYDLWPRDLADLFHRTDQELLANGLPQIYERQLPAADGSRRHVLFHKVAFRNPDGSLGGFIGAMVDITERKRAEESLTRSEEDARRLAQENAIMAEIGRIIGSTLNIGEIYESFAEEVKKLIAFDRIVINTINIEKGTVKNAYIAGEGVSDRNAEEIYPLAGSGNAEMVRTESSLLIQTEDFDAYKDRFPMLLSTFQAGFRSIMNIPLFSKGKIIGGLLLRSRKPDAYTDDDVRLAEKVGAQIAGAIANAQLYMERLQSEKERASLEEQLRQAQKIEAVGRLAGGVAHDFNNMLGVIIGHAELALGLVSSADPLYLDLQEIRKAAQRSADLTRQLLAFARRQTVCPEVLDLNETVSGMLKMLGRLIGEDIDLAWIPGRDLGKVRIDPSQIDQILANMAVNARDAIAGVGKITIETGNVALDDAYCAKHAEFVPGEYILLAVSDTGAGMSKDVLAHLFEPFFTTKKVGQGTGLGLATVHGIVRQNGGFINVYSEPGRGTTFKIYLPAFEGETVKASTETDTGKRRRGTETVLIVEDEEAILSLGRKILEQLGYKVLTANTPAQAIHMAGESSGDIHLLITDVVMPEMNGRDLAEHLASIKPGLKCLFMSGYTANVIAHQGVLDKGVRFIQKPFSVRGLAEKVREALEDQPHHPTTGNRSPQNAQSASWGKSG